MRLKNNGAGILVIIFCILLAAPFQPASAQSGSAVFRTDPPVLQVGMGQIETIKIILGNAEGVYGIDYQATFDPSVVEVVDSNPVREGIQVIPGDFIKPDFLVINTVDNKAGTIHYVITQVNPTSPASGSGVVLLIQFRGIKLGGKTTLISTSVQIADRRGNKLPNEDKGGEIIVVPPKPPTPTIVPTSISTSVPATAVSEILNTPKPTSPASTPNQEGSSVFSDQVLAIITYAGFGGAVIIIVALFILIASRKSKSK